MSDIILNDDVFSTASNWIHFYSDDRFDQRYRLEGDAIFCETLVTIRCSKEAAVSQLREAWTWWKHGKLISFRRNDDASCELDLKPISWFVTNVHLHILPPAALPEHEGVRLPVVYSRHLVGPSSIDIYPKPHSTDTVILRGRFHGIRQKVPMPFTTAAGVTKVHLGAESGTLSFPFPKGTGYVGLCDRLEGR